MKVSLFWFNRAWTKNLFISIFFFSFINIILMTDMHISSESYFLFIISKIKKRKLPTNKFDILGNTYLVLMPQRANLEKLTEPNFDWHVVWYWALLFDGCLFVNTIHSIIGRITSFRRIPVIRDIFKTYLLNTFLLLC